MGIFDSIKELLGSGAGELAGSLGLDEPLGAVTDAVGEQVGEVESAVGDLGDAVGGIAEVVPPG